MDELVRQSKHSARPAALLEFPDLADAFAYALAAERPRIRGDFIYTQLARTSGKSWLREQWMKEVAHYAYYDPRITVSGSPEFQIIGWDEAAEMPNVLIDAPSSVEHHFLTRFHKVT